MNNFKTIRTLNLFTISIGVLALIFTGVALRGGPSIAELLAAVFVIGAGTTARSHLSPDGRPGKALPVTLNILALLFVSLVAVYAMSIIIKLDSADRQIAMVLFVFIPFATAAIILATLITVIRAKQEHHDQLPRL